ncbi:MAG: hypothetical protein ACO3FE_15575, partial [Planctomycetaceae bacterium]
RFTAAGQTYQVVGEPLADSISLMVETPNAGRDAGGAGHLSAQGRVGRGFGCSIGLVWYGPANQRGGQKIHFQ